MGIYENYGLPDFLGKIIFALPVILAILYCFITDKFPKSKDIKKSFEKFIYSLIEKDIEELLHKNGFTSTSKETYQFLRVLFSVLFGFAVWFVSDFSFAGFLELIVAGFVVYKLFYIYLLMLEEGRIKKMNISLPYAIKSISYLVYVFPVANAIEKSIDTVPPEFKNDMELLLKDIDEDPVSFKPYQNFIDRYKGKLANLDTYLKVLYRIADSGSAEAEKLITNMNIQLAEDVNIAREQKNKSTNSKISYLGMIPVLLITVMLAYLLVMVVITSLNFG